MTATGAEIWEFWEKGFPMDHYNDDSAHEVDDDNGNCLLDLTRVYDLSTFGDMIPISGGKVRSVEDVFIQWKLEQATITLTIRFSREDELDIRNLLKTFKVEVL